ncbi:MAG: HD domain-containing protein [Eubacteriales bacterium]
MKLFAGIDIGSYEINLKIFEFGTRNKMREIESINYRLDLGTDSFRTGKISPGKVDELCRVLKEFSDIMLTYQVEEYVAYGTSALRETENTIILLNQIELRTGIRITVLSNSEQRFLDYKSIASKGEKFNKIIEKGTAIVDIGGGSIQISLFDKDALVATQNLKIGVLRLHERIAKLDLQQNKLEIVLDEIISAQLSVFKKLYLKDREIEHIIIVDDYVSVVLNQHIEGFEIGYIDENGFDHFVDAIKNDMPSKLSAQYNIPESNMKVLFISTILVRRVMKFLGAKLIWAPGVTLCDGIAYEYAKKNKYITDVHKFEEDIIACAKCISKRYMGSKKRGETLENIALNIFDSMKKCHGLGQRERLILRLATILHDCGKYISLTNLGECSYQIILSTEMIGLSHVERKMLANIVKYNHTPFEYYEEIGKDLDIDQESYRVIAKLAAILSIANGLDRSHKQKFKDVRIVLKDRELIITVNSDQDITVEQMMFTVRADFFEEVYNIKPIIKQKKARV